jgi:hypothetical protein
MKDSSTDGRTSAKRQVRMGVWRGVVVDSLKSYPGPAMPNPSTPCGRATPKTDLQRCLQPYSTPLDTPRRTPMIRCTELRLSG